eukprot:3833298-Pyramimonas_sp.AAC.1
MGYWRRAKRREYDVSSKMTLSLETPTKTTPAVFNTCHLVLVHELADADGHLALAMLLGLPALLVSGYLLERGRAAFDGNELER